MIADAYWQMDSSQKGYLVVARLAISVRFPRAGIENRALVKR